MFSLTVVIHSYAFVSWQHAHMVVKSKIHFFYYLQRKLHQNARVISTLFFMCPVVQKLNCCTRFFWILLSTFLSKVVWSGSIVSHSRMASFTSFLFPKSGLTCYLLLLFRVSTANKARTCFLNQDLYCSTLHNYILLCCK